MKPKVIYAVLGATATGFFIGWLIFGLILSSYYKSQMIFYQGLEKDPPEFWAILLMNLSYASLLVYIFHVWAKIDSFMKGFTAGLIVFFLVMFGFDISMYGFMNLMTFQGIIVDIIANTILGGLVGGVAGLILGIGEKKN
jgi:hypothetical protein